MVRRVAPQGPQASEFLEVSRLSGAELAAVGELPRITDRRDHSRRHQWTDAFDFKQPPTKRVARLMRAAGFRGVSRRNWIINHGARPRCAARARPGRAQLHRRAKQAKTRWTEWWSELNSNCRYRFMNIRGVTARCRVIPSLPATTPRESPTAREVRSVVMVGVGVSFVPRRCVHGYVLELLRRG